MAKISFNKSKCFGGIIKCSTTGKYLLVKGITGKWSFPKGHREKNESPFDCAKREIYEETGILVKDLYGKKAQHISIYYYFNIEYDTEVPTNPIDLNEVKDIRWFSPAETNEIEKNKDVSVYFTRLLNNTNNTNNTEIMNNNNCIATNLKNLNI